MSSRSKVIIGGMPVTHITQDQLAQQMVDDKSASLPKLVFSANGQAVAMFHTDPALRAAMEQADIIHADGMGVVFASRLFTDTPLPERIATTDFFPLAARAAMKAGLKFYFLGGTEEENRRAAEETERVYPGLICGRQNGYWSDETAVLADIRTSGANVLWVNMGRGAQEAFCVRNRAALTGVGWFKTCGGLFKFLGGNDSRAPIWLQKAGFEWLYRALREPRRLGWRYLKTNGLAIWLALTKSQSLR